MARRVAGEYLYIWYEWIRPDHEYITGHVTVEEAIAALDKEGVRHGEVSSVEHIYGRFIPGCPDDSFVCYLHEFMTGGRGAFPITRVKTR